ncbi:MAG: DUF2188 domain-containing protein [Bacteroidetes bacterium]|nr:MAG: DUF2188 domain-containing protein [Bacteroidota bacterium]
MARTIYTKSLGRAVAKQAKGIVGRYHVIRMKANRWSVVAGGRLTPSRTFATESDAIVYAKKIASRFIDGEVVIHGIDGRVIESVAC